MNTTPEQLRSALVGHIRRLGTFTSPRVEAAFHAVPRHLFLPEVSVEEAYAPQVVITKRASDGSALSSASSPNIVAAMLEQLDVVPGQRVLEIGAATGINAALLAELAGPSGRVVTIEIDADLAARARGELEAAGYDRIQVVCGDGALGHAAGAPYERIIVTAGAWDIAPAWWQQLAPAGRLVVPVRLHGSGLTRSLAFTLDQPDRLTARSARVCGFVPMRGASSTLDAHRIPLAEEITLHLDPADLDDESALAEAFTHPAHEHWTDIAVADAEPAEHLDLWLATTSPHPFTRLAVGSTARRRGLARPALRWAGAAVCDGANLAYLATRPAPTSGSHTLGVIAHGPDPVTLASHLIELLYQWSRQRPAQPIITAYPTDTPDDQLAPGYRVDRPATRLTITW